MSYELDRPNRYKIHHLARKMQHGGFNSAYIKLVLKPHVVKLTLKSNDVAVLASGTKCKVLMHAFY